MLTSESHLAKGWSVSSSNQGFGSQVRYSNHPHPTHLTAEPSSG